MSTLHDVRVENDIDAVRFIPELKGGLNCLLVLAHGVGSSMNDLVPLARTLTAAVPGLAVVSLNAPNAYDGARVGRQWFSVQGVTEENRSGRVASALPSFRKRVLAEANALGLKSDRVIAGGFSQGAIMSLSLGAGAQDEWLGIISLSGRLAGQPQVQNLCQSGLVIHGEEDRIIPVNFAQQTVDWLTQSSWDVQSHMLAGLGHRIDHRVLGLVVDYILNRADLLIPQRKAA